MLATIIARLGLPFLISLIAGALGQINNPLAKDASKSLENFQGAIQGGAVTSNQLAEANRHAEQLAIMQSHEYETALAEINQSVRAEIGSNDPYVRRMRPTFGYLMSLTWAAQMLGLAYVMIFRTNEAPAVLSGMESLSTIWGIGLSVLGIYVYRRSEDKKIAAMTGNFMSDLLQPKTPAPPVAVTKTTNVTASVKSTPPKYND